MRVPRSLERTVGRTHLWRSLGTANKAEAIRQARIVAYDLEVALRGEAEPRTDRPQIAPEALQKAEATVEPPCPPKPSEKTLRTLLPIFLNDATKVRGDKVRMIYNHTIPIVGEHKANATSPKTCFHSFRHCFRDTLREARIDHDVALALGGWSSGTGKENVETAEAYGRGFRVRTLFDALKRINYPGLDLAHLLAAPQGSA